MSRDQSARNFNREAQTEEDPERRNPRSKPQPQNEENDIDSGSSSSQSRTPSRYTTSGLVETAQGGLYQVHKGDLHDHLNTILRVSSQTPCNDEEPRDPQLGDQGINNCTNLPTAQAATTRVNIPANMLQ
uniref:Uncharacterized protein n=1 Tax=Cannabis sativa TaxID=3483 RepID=A0A803QHQ9_CANSA